MTVNFTYGTANNELSQSDILRSTSTSPNTETTSSEITTEMQNKDSTSKSTSFNTFSSPTEYDIFVTTPIHTPQSYTLHKNTQHFVTTTLPTKPDLHITNPTTQSQEDVDVNLQTIHCPDISEIKNKIKQKDTSLYITLSVLLTPLVGSLFIILKLYRLIQIIKKERFRHIELEDIQNEFNMHGMIQMDELDHVEPNENDDFV